MKSRGVGNMYHRRRPSYSTEHDCGEDMKETDSMKTSLQLDSALKRPLVKYPFSSSRAKGSRTQPLRHAPRPGAFRVKYGIQVGVDQSQDGGSCSYNY